MQHDIFLSYSHKDIEIMRQVRTDLDASGFHVWTDETLVPGTESWKNSIENAIQNTHALVVILSPDSKQSVWVERELDYAHACNVPIFPLLARGDTEVSAIPFQLINVQRADIRLNYHEGIQGLITAIRQRLSGEHQPQARREGHASSPPLHTSPHPPQKLDPWNFFDQIRFVNWLFLEPSRIANMSNQEIRQIAAWVVSGMAWIAFLAPLVGYVLGMVQMPGTSFGGNLFIVMGGLLFLGGWFVTAWIGSHEGHTAGVVLLVSVSILSFLVFTVVSGMAGIIFTEGEGLTGLAFLVTTAIIVGIAAGIAFNLANNTTGTLAGLVVAAVIYTTLFRIPLGIEGGIAGTIMVLAALGTANSIESNLRVRQPSRLGKLMLVVLIVDSAAIIWMYFLGGWQFLAGF
jgi:TIR domain